MEPQQNKGQPQHNPHKCNTSRMPKYRSNRLQQPATNRYQRDMRSKRRDAGRKMLEPRQAQAQHKPPDCNMSRIPKCRPDRSQQPIINLYQRIWDQRTKTRGEKNWNHDKPKDKHNASRTNATCHAYPNSDQTAHINLRQVDISKTRDAKKGRSEKKSWNRDEPKCTHNSSHTHATIYVFLLSKASAHCASWLAWSGRRISDTAPEGFLSLSTHSRGLMGKI